jgi:hypothetical protein
MARRPNVRAPPTILIKSTIPTLISLPREGRGREISRILQVSIGTVNIDLSILRQQAKENIRKYIDEKLPEYV